MERIEILNTFADNLTMQETVDAVDEYIIKNKPLHLMGVNADKINELQENERLRNIVNNCEIINADGVSVVWASKKLKKPLKERVAGIDLMQELLKLAEKKGYTVYLLGAKEEIVRKTVDVIQKQYPQISVVGWRNGYFKECDWPSIAEDLKKCKAQLIFVGITSPLKEYFIEYLQNQGLESVFMGVGGSFDVISGKIPRAPKWVQKMGLEWLFRVIQEPGRLWKRYLIGNTKFIKNVYCEKYRKKN